MFLGSLEPLFPSYALVLGLADRERSIPRLVVYDAILAIDLVDAVDDTTEIGGRTAGEREGGIDLALARSVAKGCGMRTIPTRGARERSARSSGNRCVRAR